MLFRMKFALIFFFFGTEAIFLLYLNTTLNPLVKALKRKGLSKRIWRLQNIRFSDIQNRGWKLLHDCLKWLPVFLGMFYLRWYDFEILFHLLENDIACLSSSSGITPTKSKKKIANGSFCLLLTWNWKISVKNLSKKFNSHLTTDEMRKEAIKPGEKASSRLKPAAATAEEICLETIRFMVTDFIATDKRVSVKLCFWSKSVSHWYRVL